MESTPIVMLRNEAPPGNAAPLSLGEGLGVRPLADAPEDLPEVFKTLIKTIHDDNLDESGIDTPTALHMAETYMEAIYKGLKEVKYDYKTPNNALLASLEHDAYHFSAAKSWHINRQLTGMLYDGTTRRSYSQFEQAALKHLGIVVGKYGRIEWNSAHSASMMAAKWETFHAHAQTMPYLVYKVSTLEHVCPICAPFDGITLPKTHSFWKWGSPLRHFQCMCTLFEVPDENVQETPENDLPDKSTVQELFRSNYPEKGLAFPENHPYYNDVPRKSISYWLSQNIP